MNAIKKGIELVRTNYLFTFLLGAGVGGGFELFKINFKFAGFNYYTSFTRLQVPKELEAYEGKLKEMDLILAEKYEPDSLPKNYPRRL
uniref:Cytochrome c oxidase assembly protein COX16 homolog, mitochondrial n=1 Tax=Parastrongyloides trichosuri TaxID=131310 RepID=A0A0N4ZEH9_PARTI